MWNNELIASITLGATATVPIVVAMTQMVKVTGWVSAKYMPFVSILMGILIAFLFSQDKNDISGNILSGLLFGLAGSGLYSGLKASTSAFRAEKKERAEEKAKAEKREHAKSNEQKKNNKR